MTLGVLCATLCVLFYISVRGWNSIMAMTEEDVMAWNEESEALEESRMEWSYVMAGETIDKVGVVTFLEKTIERCNSPVEQQKLHEILSFCQEHTFGEGVEV